MSHQQASGQEPSQDTGSSKPQRGTDEQRELAAYWLRWAGRAVTDEAVDALAPRVRTEGKPSVTELQAFVRLVKAGQVPTAAAVTAEVSALQAMQERKGRVRRDVAAAVEDLPTVGQDAAAFVAAHLESEGRAPTWHEVGKHLGWPRHVVDRAVPKLRKAGWVTFSSEPLSLRPGRRYTDPRR